MSEEETKEKVKDCTTCGYIRYRKVTGYDDCDHYEGCCHLKGVKGWELDDWYPTWHEEEPIPFPTFTYDPISMVWEMDFSGENWSEHHLHISICSRGLNVRTELTDFTVAVDWPSLAWSVNGKRIRKMTELKR